MANRIENHFCGMLVIDKEPGFTSSDVISKLRGILHMKKIGHTGTLDPMAEGVLPVCLGNGTKVAELIADHDKEYVARMRLGVTTDTQDMTGRVLSEIGEDEVKARLLSTDTTTKGREADHFEAVTVCPSGEYGSDAHNSKNQNSSGGIKKAAVFHGIDGGKPSASGKMEEGKRIESVICMAVNSFRGEIAQIPPMYSAVWSNGRRLYDLAREGKTVERKPRKATIREIEVQAVDLPYVTFRVVCSKGTYIRTLCEDIGKVLGTGAAMDHLIRTRVGIFTLDQALKLDDLQRMTDDDLLSAGILPDTSRPRFPQEERTRIGKLLQEDKLGCAWDGHLKFTAKRPSEDNFSELSSDSHARSDFPESAEDRTDRAAVFGRYVPEYSREAARRSGQIHWSVEDRIIPIDALFQDDPEVHVLDSALFYLRNGNAISEKNIRESGLPHAERIRVYDSAGNFYALYRFVPERNRILPLKMFCDTPSRESDRR